MAIRAQTVGGTRPAPQPGDILGRVPLTLQRRPGPGAGPPASYNAATHMGRISRCIKEPFAGLSHLVGALLSVAALIVLLVRADGRVWHVVSFAVYGTCLVLVYVASAMTHSIYCSPETSDRLDRFDYAAIFLMIAGTYTPLCLVPLRGPWGWALLAGVWSLAIAGVLSVYIWRTHSRWARVILYVCMGWLVLFEMGEILRTFPPAAIGWLIAGGVVYSLGAVVFITNRPNLWPGRFIAHDLWHVMVLVGSLCHFMVMHDFVAAHA